MQNENLNKLYKAGLALVIILCVYFAVKVVAEWKSYGMMGSSEANTITLSGHGEVQAVPDIANVYFTIHKEAKTIKEAQDAVAVIEAKALEVLKQNGVEDKDIKTENASFNPKYEYRTNVRSLMPCDQYGCPPYPPGKNVIVGYEAYESLNVKVRNTDSVGTIMQDLGTTGVENLNGPNFSIDDEDVLQAEARKKAIEDAQTKAEALADDLGVKLGRIASFSESGYPTPIFYGKEMDARLESGAGNVALTAQLPVGENTITSDVTITYEIK